MPNVSGINFLQLSGHSPGCAEEPGGRGKSRVFQSRDGRGSVEQLRLLRYHVKNVSIFRERIIIHFYQWLFCWETVEQGVQTVVIYSLILAHWFFSSRDCARKYAFQPDRVFGMAIIRGHAAGAGAITFCHAHVHTAPEGAAGLTLASSDNSTAI